MKSLKDFTISVKLHEKVLDGADGFGVPTYTTHTEVINQCLVAIGQHGQLTNNNTIQVALDTFTIAIPKGDTHEWRNSIVEFNLGGVDYRCKTNGDYLLGYEDAMPLMWHKQIWCSVVR